MLPPHRKYKSALFVVVQDVDKALQRIYPQKKLWKVSELDSARLTKLLVWSERYGVSLEYILETLLGYYYSSLPRANRDRAKQGRSLGVRIATLVGNASHSVLLDHLQADFPDGNNLAAFKEEEKERIADILDPDYVPRRARGILQFKTVSSYVNAYTRLMELRRKGVSRIDKKMGKIAWRGNPWK
jgi:hypothetical protein